MKGSRAKKVFLFVAAAAIEIAAVINLASCKKDDEAVTVSRELKSGTTIIDTTEPTEPTITKVFTKKSIKTTPPEYYINRNRLNEKAGLVNYDIFLVSTASVVVFNNDNIEVDYLEKGDYFYSLGLKFSENMYIKYFRNGTEKEGWIPDVSSWYKNIE